MISRRERYASFRPKNAKTGPKRAIRVPNRESAGDGLPVMIGANQLCPAAIASQREARNTSAAKMTTTTKSRKGTVEKYGPNSMDGTRDLGAIFTMA